MMILGLQWYWPSHFGKCGMLWMTLKASSTTSPKLHLYLWAAASPLTLRGHKQNFPSTLPIGWASSIETTIATTTISSSWCTWRRVIILVVQLLQALLCQWWYRGLIKRSMRMATLPCAQLSPLHVWCQWLSVLLHLCSCLRTLRLVTLALFLTPTLEPSGL